MNVSQLIWAVVGTTCVVVGCITALTVWHPGDNTAVVTAILGVATPSVSVLLLLLQGQRTAQKVEEVKQEARHVANVTAEGLESARDSARKAKEVHQKTAEVVEKVVEKVEQIKDVAEAVTEIKSLVNGRQDELRRRLESLEERVRRGNG